MCRYPPKRAVGNGPLSRTRLIYGTFYLFIIDVGDAK